MTKPLFIFGPRAAHGYLSPTKQATYIILKRALTSQVKYITLLLGGAEISNFILSGWNRCFVPAP